MKAEIIAVGSELLTPDFQDTNSQFCTAKLNEAGFRLHLKTVVGDQEDDLVGVLKAALQRSMLIIVSGGLGPTEDDLTRPAVAKALGRGLLTHQAVLEGLRRKFASRGYAMPSINERQAQVIEGAEVLENPLGTAPGMWIAESGVYLVLLPGPPRELEPMFENQVLPRIRPLGGARKAYRLCLGILGMTESEVDAQVAPLYKSCPRVETTILAGTGQISLRLSQWLEPGEDPGELQDLLQELRKKLGSALFTIDNESLEKVVADLLKESSRSLAVAESCTAGAVSNRITRIPGSSSYFLGGILCYNDAAKRRLCGVPGDIIERFGAVSAETAMALADGVRHLFQSSIGLSITGIAGPGGGTEEKPVGLVYVAVADHERTRHHRRILPGNRETVRERASFFALSCLRKFLISGGGPEDS